MVYFEFDNRSFCPDVLPQKPFLTKEGIKRVEMENKLEIFNSNQQTPIVPTTYTSNVTLPYLYFPNFQDLLNNFIAFKPLKFNFLAPLMPTVAKTTDNIHNIETQAEKPKKTFKSSDELFDHLIEYVLKDEGGFVDHPRDKGGATNMGITKKWYDANMGRVSSMEEFKSLTVEDAKEYFYKFYWKTLLKQIPELNELNDTKLTYLTFDTMLHSGLKKAKELFNAEKNKNTTTDEKAYAMLNARRDYLNDISKPGMNNDVFNGGWAWRMDKIEDRFSELA